MAFEYRDSDGARLRVDNVNASTYYGNEPVVALLTEHRDGDDVPVVYVPLDRVEEVVAGIRDAARTASGQQPAAATCAHCKGTGADPEDEGDYDQGVHMYNPTTIGPCPECHGTGKDAPAVGQPAEAHTTDRAAVLDEAADAVAAYTGNPIDANAQMLRRMAEEARS
ncbi:hypothetical protein [Streptomyces sp. NPDC002122]|uniref:hypothetical protein n=1 Tax=Streptomyces sp. NPDC002122 TaxID=3154407 RepID=UPI0033274E9E